MRVVQYIDERGWWNSLAAPETLPGDREARLIQAEAVLTALSPVIRPLALEVETCWRELDTGLPAPLYPDEPIHLLVLEPAASGVTIRPTVARPPPAVRVQRLDGKAISDCLCGDESSDPNHMLDWLTIRSVAASVRASEPIDSVTLEEVGRAILPHEPHWFAGPVGDRGFAVWPPAVLTFFAEDRVRFTLLVHWSGWCRDGSPERSAIEGALGELVQAGWAEEARATP